MASVNPVWKVARAVAKLATSSDLLGLRAVTKSTAFMEIVHGNAKIASSLRKKAEEALDAVARLS